jgi:hypothetical protein
MQYRNTSERKKLRFLHAGENPSASRLQPAHSLARRNEAKSHPFPYGFYPTPPTKKTFASARIECDNGFLELKKAAF